MRWMYPAGLEWPHARDAFDPVVAGARYRLSRELLRSIWDRVVADATDRAGQPDPARAQRAFHEIAARLAAGGGRLGPDVGRLTRVGVELDGAGRRDPVGELASRTPGRDTLVAAEERRAAATEVPSAGATPAAPATVATMAAMAAMAAPGRGAAAVAIQRKAAGGSPDAEAEAAALLARSEAGQPLPGAVRARMERALGAEFSAVRVHQGPQAEAIGALAYTRGVDIFFAPGQYDPDSQRGLALLGHELTHVVQQAQGRVQPTTRTGGLAVNDSGALEREADDLGAVAARAPREDGDPLGARAPEPKRSIVSPGSSSVVQRKPGSGGGGRAEAIVTLPDKTLFERKTYTPKPIKLLDSGEHTFIDKIIWVWDVPLRVKVTGKADLIGSFSGGIGPAMLTNSFTYFDAKSLGAGQLVKLGAAELAGHDVANAMMILFMDQEGQEYVVTTRADLPADATANLTASATLKGEIGDPLLLVAIGAWGTVTGSATATAKANAGMQVKATYKAGKWTLEGSYDLDFYLGLFLSLSATLGAFVRLGYEGENKVKRTQPKGMALTKPADWPADVPFHGDEIADQDNPLAWKKEWTKTWSLWEKQWDKKWKVAGKFDLLAGGSDGDLGMTPDAFPVGDVVKGLIDSPSDDKIPEKDPGPEPEKGPDAGRLSAAETETRLAVDKAKAAVDRESDWNNEALKDAGAAAAYKTALTDRKTKLDSYKRAYMVLVGKQHTAQRNAKSGDGPTRREALAQFNGLKASAGELQAKADTLASSRPKRINKYNAAKNGAGAKGQFSDFPDWIGYAMGVSSHPANKELALGGNGMVPQPSGHYAFAAGGETTDGAGFVRTPWKARINRELDQEKAKNGGDETAARATLVATYAAASWDDLMLVDWEGHHIHEVSWGGAKAGKSNVIFIRESQHVGFTSWWKSRGTSIVAEVAKDEP